MVYLSGLERSLGGMQVRPKEVIIEAVEESPGGSLVY